MEAMTEDAMNPRKAVAFVFPGQGSQTVGMLRALADAHPIVTETFAEASAVLGYDLWALAQQGPEQALNRTAVTQPALLAADVACYRAFRAHGALAPAVMAGHSLGEYAALVCAGALDYTDAVRLVAYRGELMQAAVPEGEGAMAAILGLADEAVEAVCRESAAGDTLAAANYNAPGQVVIAGSRAAVERAALRARAAGAKRAIVLPVSVPSHCGLMEGAAEAFAERLAPVMVREPAVPVIHNYNVQYASTGTEIREALIKQLFSPVRWTETIRKVVGLGVCAIVECGPGKVLTGLNKRIADCPCVAIGEPADWAAALSLGDVPCASEGRE